MKKPNKSKGSNSLRNGRMAKSYPDFITSECYGLYCPDCAFFYEDCQKRLRENDGKLKSRAEKAWHAKCRSKKS